MTLNLNLYESKHGPWAMRRTAIVQAIRHYNPDIVACQAVRQAPTSLEPKDQASQLAEELRAFKHVVFIGATVHPDGKHDGSAFLSRRAFKHVQHWILGLGVDSHQAEDPVRRLMLLAQLEHPALSIFNCHFSWVSRQASANIDEALTYVRHYGQRALLVGDFNTAPDSDLMARLVAEGWIDVWPRLHPEKPGYTFESDAPTKRIDYVWMRPDLMSSLKSIDLVAGTPMGESRLSDHLGLIVTLAE